MRKITKSNFVRCFSLLLLWQLVVITASAADTTTKVAINYFSSGFMSEGGVYKLFATVTAPDSVTNRTVTWASSDPSAVGVDAATGIITAKELPSDATSKSVTITATSNADATAKSTVTIVVKKTGLKRDSDGYLALNSNDDWKIFCAIGDASTSWGKTNITLENARMHANIKAECSDSINLAHQNMVYGMGGNFDGNGYTLDLNYKYVGTVTSTILSPFNVIYGKNITISDLHVTGIVYGKYTGNNQYLSICTAGLVGKSSCDSLTLNRCWSSVTVTGGDGTTGLVSSVSNYIALNDCLFDGAISTTWNILTGGMVCNAGTSVKSFMNNCLITAAFIPESKKNEWGNYAIGMRGATFYSKGTFTMNNCYCKNLIAGNKQAGTQVTEKELMDGTTCKALQAGRADTVWVAGTNSPVIKTKAAVSVEKDTVTISADGYATYYNSKAYILANGLTASTVDAITDGELTINKRYNAGAVVPAGTAVLLKGEAKDYELIIDKADAQTAPAENKLKGTDVAVTTTGGDKYFKLAKDGNGKNLGFYYGAKEGAAFTADAHTAYLALTTAEAAGDTCFALNPIVEKDTITIPASGYATYYNSKAYTLPEGLKAAIVAGVANDKLTLTYQYAAGAVVPAGTAVLLKGAAKDYELVMKKADTQTAPAENKLKGTDVAATTTGGDKYFRLDTDANGENFGFYYGAKDGAAFGVAAHAAYLALTTAEAAADTSFVLIPTVKVISTTTIPVTAFNNGFLSEGGACKLTAAADVTWTSSDETVVKVSADGTISAQVLEEGVSQNKATVTATTTDSTATKTSVTIWVKSTKLLRDADGYLVLNNDADWKTFCALAEYNVGWGQTYVNLESARMYGNIKASYSDSTKVNGQDMVYNYAGHFDGNGYQLTVDYKFVGTSATYPIAPFGAVLGSNVTVSNLHVAGKILVKDTNTATYHSAISAAGIIGKSSADSLVISKCWSSVSLSGDDATSGIIAYASKMLTMNDCLFDGAICSSNILTGGLVGATSNAKSSLNNCLVTAEYPYAMRGGSFFYTSYNGSALKVNNCYCKNLIANNAQDGTQVDNSALTDGTTVKALQASRADVIWLQGESSPVLNLKNVAALDTDSITIPAAGYITYYNSKAYTLPKGIAAAIIDGMSAEGGLNIVWKYSAGDVVPAGTAVIFKGEADKYCLFLKSADTLTTPAVNKLKGADHDATTTGGDVYYKLSYDKDGKNFGFYFGADNGAAFVAAAHTAYVALSTAENGKNSTFTIEGKVTAISSASVDNIAGNQTVYTISGMRMMNAKNLKPGLYIVNGKKFVIK